MATTTYKVSSSCLSDVGRRRRHNEDAVYASDGGRLWVVADGMGGHHAGEVASQNLIHNLAQFQPAADITASCFALQDIIQHTNRQILSLCEVSNKSCIMGTTVALLHTHDSEGVIIWAGDSRVYRIRQAKVEQLTADHSIVQELIQRGELHPDDAEDHPESNVITRAIGIKENPELESLSITVQGGDRYLICSDGLYRYLSTDEMAEIIANDNIQDANRQLVDTALNLGGKDNISSILIEFNSDTTVT